MPDNKKETLFIRFEDCVEKLEYMLNATIERYGFDKRAADTKEEAIIFACSKGSIGTELEIARDYILKINEIRKELEALDFNKQEEKNDEKM